MNKFKIPKVGKIGKQIFLTHKYESPISVKIEIKVRSDLCPEQVAHSGTTCQVQLIAYNGDKILSTIEKLTEITKDNLDDSSSRKIHFSAPKNYVEVVLLVVCV